MPTLTLEPDEVLPTTPAPLEGEASGPFPIKWRGQKRQFWLRAVELRRSKHVLFACEVDNEAAGNWLIYSRMDLVNLAPATWSPRAPRGRLGALVQEFNRRGWGLGRFFTFPGRQENQVFRLLLGDNGVGAWLNKEFRVSAAFDFPEKLIEGDRAQNRRFWQSERADFNSNLSFAERWAGSGFSVPRGEVVWNNHRPELEQILRWGLMCEPNLWPRGDNWIWRLALQSPNFGSLGCAGSLIGYFPTEVPLLGVLGRFLVKTHVPRLLCEVWKHRAIRDFLEDGWNWPYAGVSDPPTAHERLEAALNLRDWLRQNHAPAELLALLNSSSTP